MDPASILISLFALIFVLSLILIVSFLLRKYGAERVSGKKTKRLDVKEIKLIDAKNKLVLVTCDEKEYLLAVSLNNISILDKK